MLAVGGARVRGGPRGRRSPRDWGGARVRGGPRDWGGARVRGGPRDWGGARVRGGPRGRGGARVRSARHPRSRGFPDSVQPRTGNANALRSGDYRGWRRHDAGP
mgnify:CR=1 FL=1